MLNIMILSGPQVFFAGHENFSKPPLLSCSLLGMVKKRIIVWGVRATKGLFGSGSSKSTKFGPEVNYAIGLTFLT